ncbi:serine/threonine-protein kinase [Nonomuraea sp. NPDC049309]|uniref:serine/threonine-protein kinase n=1 Tax=Nonomuraea sp. NPDC049309 TaxID=3364350 RepID=UPI00371D42A6
MSAGRLAGRYLLERPLGAGGMGKVWQARDEMLQRDVAVKELTLPEGMPDKERAEAVTRAVREAQAMARLRHPGIVALHDVVVEQDRPWLVMELLRGRTLGDTVRDFGPMPADYAAKVGADVLEALMAAHAQGLQHRDVKPGNVFITESGRVVLTDFGIARQEGQATLTQQGLMVGSPGFIAPERLEGHPGGPASDMWSLGATLYAALTGTPAYVGSVAERVRATLTRPVPVAPGPLGPIVAAMMAQNPAARPDPRLVVQALRQVAAGGSAPALPVPDVPTQPSGAGGHGKMGVLVAAVVVVALAAAATTVFLWLRDRDGVAAAGFTTPLDVCKLISEQELSGILVTRNLPEAQPDADDAGPECAWALPQARTGVSVQVQKDSDTVDPWSMTEASARTLFQNQKRWWGRYDSIDWTWPEIGQKTSAKAARTPLRDVPELGDEAFAFELAGPTGQMHSAYVFYRLANLVVAVSYTTLADGPTDAQIQERALRAAQASIRTLRDGG